MSSSSESKSSGEAPEPVTSRARARAGTPGGSRLRAVREQAGRSQLWVEAEADLGTGYLQRVESGRVALPGRVTVERVLDALEARYSERRDVLELFGYVVTMPLPTPDEIEWARQSCQHELHGVPFPAYVLDCYPRLIEWNRFVPRLLGEKTPPPGPLPIAMERGRKLATDELLPSPRRRGEGGGGPSPEDILARHVGQSMLAPWFDPGSPFGALIAEPDVLLPAFVRALRFEIEAYRSEPWLAEMLAHLQAELPLFRDHWLRAEQEPPPISAARTLVPVTFDVPGVGRLQFRLVSEPFVRDARFRLIYYVPGDPTTMRQCAAWATDE